MFFNSRMSCQFEFLMALPNFAEVIDRLRI